MFSIDESHWPIILATWAAPFAAPPPTAAVMREFLAVQLETCNRAGAHSEKIAYVHLAVTSAPLGSDARKVATEWRKANPHVAEIMVGNWVVTQRRGVAGVLTALQWFLPETREKVLIVGTMDEALAQARAAIAAAHEPNWRKRSAAH
jgi:hypothetical protein